MLMWHRASPHRSPTLRKPPAHDDRIRRLRPTAVHHRRAESRERFREQPRVVRLLRRRNGFARHFFGFLPLAQPTLILRDHVEQRRFLRAIGQLARCDEQLAACGDRLARRLALQRARAFAHAAQSEDCVVVRTAGEAGQRAVAQLLGQRVAAFRFGDFGQSMQRMRALDRIARGAFGDLEEAASLGVRVHASAAPPAAIAWRKAFCGMPARS